VTAAPSSRTRDQEESAFTTILRDFVKRVPGAFAATVVDGDGECVDYAGDIEPFDVKIAGAHWAIVVHEISQRPAIGPPQDIICRGEKRSFIVHALPERYSLVVLLKKRAGFVSVTRAIDACERALAQEAAWDLPKGRGIWIAVDVETDERKRPIWLTTGSLSCSVEVLGTLTRLRKRERGFRVRLPSGGELNLVREVGDRWYADEKVG
jgi:predicted regulator of Ras-like GTPase activity (Roadblock/LC7/MglB family)